MHLEQTVSEVDVQTADEYVVPKVHEVHVEQDVAEEEEYVPAAQFVQLFAPAEDEYVPAGQLVHVNEPSIDENVPAAQVVQDFAPATDE